VRSSVVRSPTESCSSCWVALDSEIDHLGEFDADGDEVAREEVIGVSGLFGGRAGELGVNRGLA
jgi:hypothetical protein